MLSVHAMHSLYVIFLGIVCEPLNEQLGMNGNVYYNNSDLRVMTTANISCKDGFSLQNGSHTRICEQDDQTDTTGKWSGKMPTCERKSCTWFALYNI